MRQVVIHICYGVRNGIILQGAAMFFGKKHNGNSRMVKSRAAATRHKRRALFLEGLEQRRVLATLYVDAPGDYTFTDNDSSGGLSNGDTVTWYGSPAPVSGLTYGTNAFGAIQAAANASAAGDTISIATGNYNEAVTLNATGNRTILNATGNPNNVVIDAPGGTGLTVTGGANIVISNIKIINAATALSASGMTSLTLDNIRTSANTAGGSLSNIGTLNIDTGGGPETIRVNVNSSDVVTPGEFSISGQVQAVTLSAVTLIDLDTGNGDDVVKIAPNANTNVDYDAGAGSLDTLVLLGAADDLAHVFSSDTGGSVIFEGTPVVAYANLEQITDSMTVGSRYFSAASVNDETITLSDDGTAANNMSRIDSTLGVPVVFKTPTYGLTIQTESNGGDGVDMVSIQGVDSQFSADLYVAAGTNDLVQFSTTPTDIDYGYLEAVGGAIQINQPVTTTGWARLDATNGNISGTGLLTAEAAMLEASGNAGSPSPLLSTSVDFLEADVGGSIYVTNDKPLTIGGATFELTGISAGGDVDVRANGALTVNDSCYFPSDVRESIYPYAICGCGGGINDAVSAAGAPPACGPGVLSQGGDIILQARETGPVVDEGDSWDDLWIVYGNNVAAQTGSVTLNAGDGVYADGNTLISATTFVRINVDNGANQLGADTDSDGGIVDLTDIELGDAEVIACDGATIVGGNDDDQFYIGDSQAFADSASSIDGDAGDDTLDLWAFDTVRQVTLTGLGSIDGYQGNQRQWNVEEPFPPGASFDNIDTVVGTPYADILYGPDRNNYWDLHGNHTEGGEDNGTLSDLQESQDPDEPSPPCNCDEEPEDCDGGGGGGGGGGGDVQDIDFIGFENLRGGDQQDWFDVAPNFTLTETLGGGANEPGEGDTLDYRQWTTTVDVDLLMGTASAITDGLIFGDAEGDSSIEDVLGGEGNDTIRGDDDANLLRGNLGDDTLNGRVGVDDINGGLGLDTIEVALEEAIDDQIVGGPGVSLDPTDIDTMLNVGEGTVVLRKFNNSYNDFSNSIDIYDAAGFDLSGAEDASPLHLGLTDLINATSILGAASNDSVTTAYASNLNGGAGPVTYDGGAGTSDSILLTFQATTFAAFTDADIAAIRNYVDAPTGATLDLSVNTDVNIIAQGFEFAGVAVYDDAQVYVITPCFTYILFASQIRVGTAGDDTIAGTADPDLIFGLEGADVISGLASNDCIFGGEGADSVNGGDGWDLIVGGTDNDTLHGNDGLDSIFGGSGNDTLYGDENRDYLYGQGGDDLLYGGDGATNVGDMADYIEGNDGEDVLWGGLDNDTMLGGDDTDTLQGESGFDILNGGAGVDTILGGTEDDDIQTQGDESEFDAIDGGAGDDRLTNIDVDANPADIVLDSFSGLTNGIEYIFANYARIIGNTGANVLDFRRDNSLTPSMTVTIYNATSIEGCQGNDTIYGTLAPDNIYGNAGNDLIYGFNGDDDLFGGTGNDTLYGASGADALFGGNGDDILYGEGDADELHGENGADQLYGGDGGDVLEGGLGGDILSGGNQDDVLLTQGAEGLRDSFDGGAGLDRLTNSNPNPAVAMQLTTFDGKTNSVEVIYAYGAEMWGDNAAAPAAALIDFRQNLAASSFVTVYNLAAVRGATVAYTIHGSNAADVIYGEGGADVIFGYGGNDTIDGGDGNDSITGGAGADTISGGDGDDILNGDGDDDTLFGNDGADTLNGGDGNDALTGGVGADVNFGGAGNDDYRVAGADAGGDSFSDSSGATDRITNTAPLTDMALGNFTGPTAGIEYIYGYGSKLVGTDGNDTIDLRRHTATPPTLFVTLYNVPSIDAGLGADTIHGTNGADVINGGAGDDVIYGYGGNDTIDAGADNDTVFGGAGADQIVGGTGDDSLSGEADADTILGGAGADTLLGGDGNDVLDGGADTDTVDGGAGTDDIRTQGSESVNDTLQGGAGTTDRLTNIGAPGVAIELASFLGQTNGIEFVYANNAEIWGTRVANTLDFRRTASTFLTLYNVMAIRGLGGDDTIHGTAAADVIYGDDGNDSIFGYGGNDTIDGGLGVDFLAGGTGVDSFRFTYSATDEGEQDTISDWSADYIRLTGYAGTSYAAITLTGALPAKVLNINPTSKKITLTNVNTKPSSTYIQIF